MAETYTYCRNRRCRTKLPHVTEMGRAAFCSRHCFVQFYSRHCLVCEKDTEPKSMNSRKPEHNFCGRKCTNAFRRDPSIYRLPTALSGRGSMERVQPVSKVAETPTKPRVRIAPRTPSPPFFPIMGFPLAGKPECDPRFDRTILDTILDAEVFNHTVIEDPGVLERVHVDRATVYHCTLTRKEEPVPIAPAPAPRKAQRLASRAELARWSQQVEAGELPDFLRRSKTAA